MATSARTLHLLSLLFFVAFIVGLNKMLRPTYLPILKEKQDSSILYNDSKESMKEEILNLKTQLSDVKMELSEARNDQETLMSNITNSNSEIVMELGLLKGNLERLLSDVEVELKQTEENQELLNNVKIELSEDRNDQETLLSNSKIVMKYDGLGLVECSEADGFFHVPGSGNKCFKLTATKQTWEASMILCQSQGLQLAKADKNPVAVRRFIVDKFGEHFRIWIGGRGTGQQTVAWNDGWLLSNDSSSPFWIKDQGVHTDTNYCLDFLTEARWMDTQPDMPYWTDHCSYSMAALCELA